jgi:hypothetical protein
VKAQFGANVDFLADNRAIFEPEQSRRGDRFSAARFRDRSPQEANDSGSNLQNQPRLEHSGGCADRAL